MIKKNKKLIYVLNHYSKDDKSHFYHVINLLETLANNDVKIVLIIEKVSSRPQFTHPSIKVILQKKTGILRSLELYYILVSLNKKGFKKCFIRISQKAALMSIIAFKIYGGQTYYWHSGKTHVLDKDRRFDLKTFKWFFNSYLPFRLVVNFIDSFVTGPESMMDYYESVVGVKKSKLICLYNDVDLKRFKKLNKHQKNHLRNELSLGQDDKIILFVHRLSPVRKSLFYMPFVILDSIKQANTICLIIGGGSELSELKLQINNRGLNDKVFTLGEKSNSDIHKYYQIADVFINPTFTEGFPRVLIEAMASGLPIVTTNAGGIKDILGPQQLNFMVDVHDRQAFSEKLQLLLGDNNIQSSLIEENHNSVNRFSTENVAQNYIKAIFIE
jgi:glycosyltransferase involved in cell wall biosynthesis